MADAPKGSIIYVVYLKMDGGYDQAQQVKSSLRGAEEIVNKLRDKGYEAWVGTWIVE